MTTTRTSMSDLPLLALLALTAFAVVLSFYLWHAPSLRDIAGVLCGVSVLGLSGRSRFARAERLRRSGIVTVDTMDGVEFEQRLGSLYESLGYRVQPTAVTGDFGADLVLARSGVRTVVQAK